MLPIYISCIRWTFPVISFVGGAGRGGEKVCKAVAPDQRPSQQSQGQRTNQNVQQVSIDFKQFSICQNINIVLVKRFFLRNFLKFYLHSISIKSFG